MTARPLDPYTLRQAAARWPIETLSSRSAQSFLRSLAEDQSATVDPLRAELRDLLMHVGTREGHTQQIHADTIRSLLTQYPHASDPELITYLQQRRQDALRAIRACADASPDYWRWQGHAELSRQLLTRLGAEVPQ